MWAEWRTAVFFMLIPFFRWIESHTDYQISLCWAVIDSFCLLSSRWVGFIILFSLSISVFVSPSLLPPPFPMSGFKYLVSTWIDWKYMQADTMQICVFRNSFQWQSIKCFNVFIAYWSHIDTRCKAFGIHYAANGSLWQLLPVRWFAIVATERYLELRYSFD